MTDFTFTANRLCTHPFIVTKKQTADHIGVCLDTAVVDGHHYLGIYQDNNGLPGALLLDAGENAPVATGLRPITISQVLTPGRYWLVVCCKAAEHVHAFYHYYVFSPMGWKDDSPSMVYAASVGVRRDVSYGPLPNPFGAGTEVAGAFFPMVFLRFSA